MNDDRRKLIRSALAMLEEAEMILDEVSSEETDAYEAISERFPGSEQEASLSESASGLAEACDDLVDLRAKLEGVL